MIASRPIGEITLQEIADGADVTVQTVLRHLGSRDGCFLAVGERVASRIDTQRGASAPGDIHGAIAGLMTHYEAEGRLVLHLLAEEPRSEYAASAAAQGRDYHRAWIERCFGPLMDGADAGLVDALVAATDLYVWKLLRLDLERPAQEAEAVIERLVRALLEES